VQGRKRVGVIKGSDFGIRVTGELFKPGWPRF
jgi:hypothetical protein